MAGKRAVALFSLIVFFIAFVFVCVSDGSASDVTERGVCRTYYSLSPSQIQSVVSGSVENQRESVIVVDPVDGRVMVCSGENLVHIVAERIEAICSQEPNRSPFLNQVKPAVRGVADSILEMSRAVYAAGNLKRAINYLTK